MAIPDWQQGNRHPAALRTPASSIKSSNSRTNSPARKTAPEERLVALKFILHLVGDVHQPLHAADDHDAGGNRKQVAADRVDPWQSAPFLGYRSGHSAFAPRMALAAPFRLLLSNSFAPLAGEGWGDGNLRPARIHKWPRSLSPHPKAVRRAASGLSPQARRG